MTIVVGVGPNREINYLFMIKFKYFIVLNNAWECQIYEQKYI